MQLSNILSYREQVSRSNSWGHHFIFLNALLAVLTGAVYFYAAPPSDDFLTFAYLFVTWLGHMGFLTFLTYIVILFPLSFIGQYRLYRILATIVMLMFFFALLVDAKLFLAAKVHLSLSVLSLMIGDLDFKTGLNFNFMFIAMPVVLILEIVFFKLSTRELYRRLERHTYFPATVIAILCICFISSHSIHIWADAVRYDKINILRSVFPFHYPMTARSFLSSHGWIDSDLKGSDSSGDASLNYPLTDLEVNTENLNRNLILILVNGLSYEDLSAELTPNLLDLKKSSNSYENSYLPYSNFGDNLFALAYGLPVQYRNYVENKNIVPIVAEEMHRQEYTIRFISDGQGSLDNNDIIRITGNRRTDFNSLKTDEGVFAKAQDFLNNLNQSRSFTLTLNLKNLSDPKLKNRNRDRMLKDTDKEIAAFLTYLENSGRLDNTLVVITSALGNPQLANQTVYNRDQQHVPMLLKWPNGSMKGVSFSGVASLFDISATIGKNLLGIVTPASEYTIGYDLLSSPNRDFIVSSQGDSLLLIASDAVTVYQRDGRAYIENDGKHLPIRPNLENLIRAMRDLNRFK